MLCDPLRAHAPPEQRRYLTRLTHARVVACRSVATLTAESAVRLLRRTHLVARPLPRQKQRPVAMASAALKGAALCRCVFAFNAAALVTL